MKKNYEQPKLFFLILEESCVLATSLPEDGGTKDPYELWRSL